MGWVPGAGAGVDCHHCWGCGGTDGYCPVAPADGCCPPAPADGHGAPATADTMCCCRPAGRAVGLTWALLCARGMPAGKESCQLWKGSEKGLCTCLLDVVGGRVKLQHGTCELILNVACRVQQGRWAGCAEGGEHGGASARFGRRPETDSVQW